MAKISEPTTPPVDANLSPTVDIESSQLPMVDKEIQGSAIPRQQAAQTILVPTESSSGGEAMAGWAIGLGLAGVLILATGLIIRRKGLPELLIS
jgi:hypothetical protein